MAIDFTVLFTRWGKLLGGSNEVQTLINTTLATRVDTIDGQYDAAQQDVVDGLYSSQAAYRAVHQGWQTDLQTMMSETLIEMAMADGTGINPETLDAALVKLISQMVTANEFIDDPTVTATVTAGSGNVGNGKLIASVLDPVYGTQQDYAFDETITALCTDDGYTGGGASAGSEPWTATGEIGCTSIYQYNFPLGSSGSADYTTLDPTLTSGLILENGDFENWAVTDTPDDWTIAVGTPSTTIFKGASAYMGSFDLQFTGNGAELTSLRQTITLSPNTVYACGFWAKNDGSLAAGVLRVRLVNGSNAVITDNAGNDNTFSVTLSALNGTYAFQSGFFRTPAVMPSVTKLEFALTTAITNTEVCHFDCLAIQACEPVYAGGPYLAFFAGSTDFATDDTFTIAVANNATTSTFVLQLARYLGLRELGLKIPSGVATQANALIS